MPKRSATDRLPLKDLELVILMSLTEGPLHGYSLLERVGSQSSGFVIPGPTSLYRTISNLLEDEMIEEAPAPSQSNDDPRRRYFRQTAYGRAVLRSELRRLAGLVNRARQLGISFDAPER